ncbi:MAG TPA: MFS transporter [Bryobacteraceae bacterium]|nr:MFS transporter [Bryobacteraceae bacterium]
MSAPAAVAAKGRRGLAPEWVLIGFLWGCYVLNHADRQVVYTLFPALQKQLGFSDTGLGMTGALFLWVYGLCSPFSGVLGDRISKTKLVVGSLAVWSTFTLLSGFSPTAGALLTCRGLLGVSESLFMPAAYALMAAAHGPETRSRAIAIFGTSQLVGVALGGSLSALVAEHFLWRVSFWMLGAVGICYAWPLSGFFRRMPEAFRRAPEARTARAGSMADLLHIPTLWVVNWFVAVATYGLFLVYAWLPTFLYDKFHLGLARAGFEASVYPQVGTALGLLVGSTLADRYYQRLHSARYWVILAALFGAGPCVYLIGAGVTLQATRIAAIAFGFFTGSIICNQVAAAYDVVPASLRASTVGLLNLLGALISGFGPFLGGLARRTIGVDRLLGITGLIYLATALLVLYSNLRFFARDHARVQER